MAKEKKRITIKDLPKDKKISKDEMKRVFGGFYYGPPVSPVSDMPPVTNWPRPEDLSPIYSWKPIWKK
jgi:hypothetical protein